MVILAFNRWKFAHNYCGNASIRGNVVFVAGRAREMPPTGPELTLWVTLVARILAESSANNRIKL